MLSLFPTLFAWSEVAPLLTRLTLGAILLFWAYKAFRGFAGSSTNKKAVAIIELIVGLLLVIGLWTQAAAIVAAIEMLILLVERAQKKAFFTDGVNYYFILLIMAVTLILTGPGIWARDIIGL